MRVTLSLGWVALVLGRAALSTSIVAIRKRAITRASTTGSSMGVYPNKNLVSLFIIELLTGWLLVVVIHELLHLLLEEIHRGLLPGNRVFVL